MYYSGDFLNANILYTYTHTEESMKFFIFLFGRTLSVFNYISYFGISIITWISIINKKMSTEKYHIPLLCMKSIDNAEIKYKDTSRYNLK